LLQESAIFIVMICVGITTMLFSNYGFVGINKILIEEAKERIDINKKSAYLFAAVLISFVISVVFKGNIAISVVTPIVALALFQRYLMNGYRLQTA
jgi:hypothetical protein